MKNYGSLPGAYAQVRFGLIKASAFVNAQYQLSLVFKGSSLSKDRLQLVLGL